jgi:transposase
MIGSTRSVRVFAYTRPADLRKGFDGLSGLVASELGRDVLSGDCFLFCSRKRRSAKVLMWDGTGLCIFSKRLEQGLFACLWKRGHDDDASAPLELTMSELALFIEGSELVGKRALSPAQFLPRSLEERPAS